MFDKFKTFDNGFCREYNWLFIQVTIGAALSIWAWRLLITYSNKHVSLAWNPS